MKLATLVHPAFQQALSSLTSKEIPALASFKLKSIKKAIGEELSKFEEVRKENLEKYADKDENGKAIIESNTYKLGPDNLALFNQALIDLGNLEVEIGSVKLAALGSVSIKADDLLILDGVVIE